MSNNTIIHRNCATCGTSIRTTAKRTAAGRGKFCSGKCYFLGRDRSLIDRFKKFAGRSNENGCILWSGAVNSHGYGKLTINKKSVAAHRVAYELAYGTIPAGMSILHSCDNPLCVNHEHLRAGTPKDNTLDCISKGRNSFGSRHKNSKLDEAAVASMRLRRGAGESIASIASSIGISRTSASYALCKRSWRHVP